VTSDSLPVVRPVDLPLLPSEKRWLINDLWSDGAVGIIGGEPKCGKSILALSIAVAVSGGVPCLGQFAVQTKGRVLLFAAEDALHIVRSRLEAISFAHGVTLSSLDIGVITSESMRVDLDDDYRRLVQTIEQLRPRVLILDPFVRLHRIDENSSGEVAPLLGKLRALQRTFHCAVILVHHARKDAGNTRAGQALRGSSEFHAWGDTNLYLRRSKEDTIGLTVEHRAERSIPKLTLTLASNEFGPFHRIVQDLTPEQAPLPPAEAILTLLKNASAPLSQRAIRANTKLRSETVSLILRQLVAAGTVVQSTDGFSATALR